MKIVLITSEELHPENHFNSGFELAQARAIKKQGITPAIISVRIPISVQERIVNVVKGFIALFWRKYRPTNNFEQQFSQLFKDIFKIWPAPVKQYKIEGITVFEGRILPLFHTASFEQRKARWVKAGMKAYALYEYTFGRPELVHAHSRFLMAGILAMAIKKERKLEYVVTEHCSYYARKRVPPPSLPYVRQMFLDSRVNIMVSRSLGQLIQDEYVPEIKNDWRVIPNILHERFEKKDFVFPPQSGFNIVSIGWLEPNKNQALLIKALSKIGSQINWTLTIIGSGPSLDDLKALVEDLKLTKQVLFTGQIHPDKIITILDQSHLFVITSKYETFSVVAIEALSRGRPVISTRCFGPEEIISKGNGILVNNDDHENLAEAILTTHRNYASYDLKKIRAQAIQTYGSAAVAQQLLDVYDSALSN